MARCQCGESSPDDARFCASCGSALGEETGLLGVTNAGSSSAGAGVTTVATTGGVDRRFLVVAVMLLAAVIGWAAWTGSSEVESADSSSTTLPGADAPTSTAPTSTAPTSTAPTSMPAATSTIGAISSATPPSTLGEGPALWQLGDGSPLLGEPTGLRLLVGHNVNRPTVVDLDTGELFLAPKTSAAIQPTAIFGDWLIARTADRLVAVPLNDLGAEPVTMLPDSQGQIDLIPQSPRQDGLGWVVENDMSERTLQLIDLATGRSIAQGPSVDHDEPVWVLSPPSSSGAPTLLGHLSGGVYEAGAEGYRRVALGRLMTADDTRVLVETCDDHLRCAFTWFDRETWEPLDLDSPQSGGDQITFIAGTDWLAVLDYAIEGRELLLLNVETGAQYEVEEPHIDPMAYGIVGSEISPDGRWLALRYGLDITIVDLETGTEYPIEGVGSAPASLMLTDAEIGYSFN